MGRDDVCQSVGVFQHRLKKTPPKPPWPKFHPAPRQREADTPHALLDPAHKPRLYVVNPYVNHNVKPGTSDDPTKSTKYRVYEPSQMGKSFSEYFPAERKREAFKQKPTILEEGSGGNELQGGSDKMATSRGGHHQEAFPGDLDPSSKAKTQASKYPPIAAEPASIHTIPTPTLHGHAVFEPYPSSKLQGIGPAPASQYSLPRFQRIEATRLLHTPQPSFGGTAGWDTPGGWPHRGPGETYEGYKARFIKYWDEFRIPNQGAEGDAASTTPPGSPPASARKFNVRDDEGAKKHRQPDVSSESDSESAEAGGVSITQERQFRLIIPPSAKTKTARHVEPAKGAGVSTTQDKQFRLIPPSNKTKIARDMESTDGAGVNTTQDKRFRLIFPSSTKTKTARQGPVPAASGASASNPTARPSGAGGEQCQPSPVSIKSEINTKPEKPMTDLPTSNAGEGSDKRKELSEETKWTMKLTLDDLGPTKTTSGPRATAEDLGFQPAYLSAPSKPHTTQQSKPKAKHSASKKPTSTSSRECLFLTLLPLEIRRLIYRSLLCTPKVLRAGELVEDKRTTIITPDTIPTTAHLSLSSTFLRTCRQIYTEALPLLYTDNTFGFSKVSLLRIFRTKGLAWSKLPHIYPTTPYLLKNVSSSVVHAFAFRPERQGRLAWVRSLHLRFTLRGRGTASCLRGMRSPLWSGAEWHGGQLDSWVEFLNEERSAADGVAYVTFPSLQDLVLDFSEWDLKPDEGLRTRVFEARFRGKDGLGSLTTVGLSHRATIQAFQERLVGKGGKMRILEKDALRAMF